MTTSTKPFRLNLYTDSGHSSFSMVAGSTMACKDSKSQKLDLELTHFVKEPALDALWLFDSNLVPRVKIVSEEPDFVHSFLRQTALVQYHRVDRALDLHALEGAAMAGIPINQVTMKDRADGKRANFAALYSNTAPEILAALKASQSASALADMDRVNMEARLPAPALNFSAQMQHLEDNPPVYEHKGKKWGDMLRYKTDDRDVDQQQLCIMQGGNGDWYVSVADGPDSHPLHGIRICTSGGAAAACPGLGRAIAAAYQAMWNAYIQT